MALHITVYLIHRVASAMILLFLRMCCKLLFLALVELTPSEKRFWVSAKDFNHWKSSTLFWQVVITGDFGYYFHHEGLSKASKWSLSPFFMQTMSIKNARINRMFELLFLPYFGSFSFKRVGGQHLVTFMNPSRF